MAALWGWTNALTFSLNQKLSMGIRSIDEKGEND
jgi:hypothetical protein